MLAAAWPLPEPSTVKIPSAESRSTVVSVALRPIDVSTATASVVPTCADGHAKLTSVGEAYTTGTEAPLTNTRDSLVPCVNQPPRAVARDPAEHTDSEDPLAGFR